MVLAWVHLPRPLAIHRSGGVIHKVIHSDIHRPSIRCASCCGPAVNASIGVAPT